MKFKRHAKKFIYAFLNEANNQVKIGISHNVLTRLTQVEYAEKVTIRLLGAVLIDAARAHEYALHETLASFRVNGEWFDYTSQQVKDIVSLIVLDDVDSIQNLCPRYIVA